MFQARSIRKIYDCLVYGEVKFQEGSIEEPIGRHPGQRTRMAIRYDQRGKEAFTEYRVEEKFRYSTYLKVRIITGRTHQIRVHFAHLGHPVVGDAVYGKKSEDTIALHARELEFDHPITGNRVHCTAPLPEAFKQILERERTR